jgi:hypothetical protein
VIHRGSGRIGKPASTRAKALAKSIMRSVSPPIFGVAGEVLRGEAGKHHHQVDIQAAHQGSPIAGAVKKPRKVAIREPRIAGTMAATAGEGGGSGER